MRRSVQNTKNHVNDAFEKFWDFKKIKISFLVPKRAPNVVSASYFGSYFQGKSDLESCHEFLYRSKYKLGCLERLPHAFTLYKRTCDAAWSQNMVFLGYRGTI